MKKKILICALSAVLSLLLFGCNIVGGSVTELMKPPKAVGEKAEIQALIDAEAGSNYTLKYPQSGNFRSAITMQDIDGDSSEEAFAFYLPSGEISTVQLLIMDIVGDTWQVIGNLTSQSHAVEFITFADLDGNGISEIITGWKTYNSSVNKLSVYLFEDNRVREVTCDYTCASVLAGDFVKGNGDELLLLSLFSSDKEANATLINLSESKNVMTMLGTTPMNPDVASYAQLLLGNIFENQFGAAVDGCTKNGEYNSQLIYYNTHFKSLECISFTENVPYNQALRNYAVKCKDIDGDGIIEVPAAFRLNIESSRTEVVAAAEIYWCQQTELDTVLLKKHTAASFAYNFTFDIPKSWSGKFTAYTDYSTNLVTFYEWNEFDSRSSTDDDSSVMQTDTGKTGEKLLEIKMFSKNSHSSPDDGYTFLSENDSYIYAYAVPASNSNMLLSNEEITQAFNLM